MKKLKRKVKHKRNPSTIKINDISVLEGKKVVVMFNWHFDFIIEGKLQIFGDPYLYGYTGTDNYFAIKDTKINLIFPLNAIKTSYFKDKNPIIELSPVNKSGV